MSLPQSESLPVPLIDAAALRSWIGKAVVLDASFDLADPAAGARDHAAARLPTARHIDLDRDLCTARTGLNGRHPLPTRAEFAVTLGRFGIGPDTPVVVYDRQGAAFAARVWWMLRWMGHQAVAVLDGGLSAWQAIGGVIESGEARSTLALVDYPVSEEPGMPTWTAAQVLEQLGQLTLIDARAPARYRGEVEPLDPVAGHIPGALNRPFQDNLGPDGRFLPAAMLHRAFDSVISARIGPVVNQCGSGVTACHNLLAMEVAGLRGSALYPGSWSEWCADPSRPVRNCAVSIRNASPG
jgi:thiosulfate/3-mercaptopyruvate sulfurtransferase